MCKSFLCSFRKPSAVFCAEHCELPTVERFADTQGQFVVKIQIMHHAQPERKDLIRLEKMSEIGA